MTRISGRIERGFTRAAFDDFYRQSEQAIERAALRATDQAARQAKNALRGDMAGAGLGRLGNAFGDGSDLRSGRGVKRYSDGGFSASGAVFIRSRSERTRGAIEAYTEGATISPRRGRWLWFPTNEVPARIGRLRTTPERYIAAGSPLGRLITIRSVNGNPLLAVENIGVNAVGARGGRGRSLTKSGRPRKGDRLKQLSVLFVGIPNTSRAARIDADAILKAEAARLPELWSDEMRKEGRR